MSRQILTRSTSKNVATFHAKLPETVMTRTIERVITPYTRSTLKYLHRLTAVSDAAAEYVRTLTKKPVTIIPNGIDLAKYQQIHNMPSGRLKTILYIGRLERRKGVKFLLKAYAELLQREPNVELIIAGDGPDLAKLHSLVANLSLPRVQFLGYVDEAKKQKLLSEADVFCSPALYGESFGIVLLEAMAVGMPVVAGNNLGYEGVMQDTGALSLVNPKDTVEFARRLALFLYDEKTRELWQQWATKYVQQFSYPLVVDQYEQLYRDVWAGKDR